ncbi:MAG: acetyl-CoA carboxylase carboxyltransferase subunit beta [Aquificae bacterium]|nr:acetyl-CoA carboxylase carboxyltransferase subunit beta [Aquificota bacterium]
MKLFDFFKRKKTIPEGLWTKCPNCKELLYTPDLRENLWVCPECGYHFRIDAKTRIDFVLDPEGRRELFKEVQPTDPLKFEDLKPYSQRLEEAKKKSTADEAIVFYEGKIYGRPVLVGAMDFNFIGGSMGSVVGERFFRACRYAVEKKLPLVVFTASGGARMQESILSLMQMAKTTFAVGLLKEKRLPYLTVLTDPTMGGVSASFAFLGDVIVAEPGARIGFAGARVIEQTIKQKLPKGFQTAEFLLEKGLIDDVVHRKDLKDYLRDLLDMLYYKASEWGLVRREA